MVVMGSPREGLNYREVWGRCDTGAAVITGLYAVRTCVSQCVHHILCVVSHSLSTPDRAVSTSTQVGGRMPSIDLGNGPSNDRDFIQSIERGFAVLHAFDDKDPNPSLAELAAKTDLSRPAVRRILLTLQKLGYVTSHGTRWALTPRVLSIGRHYTESHTLVDSALPKLVEIAEHTNESASLGVLDGTEVVYAARVPV